jgi:uncharacterized protein (DUF433 family)
VTGGMVRGRRGSASGKSLTSCSAGSPAVRMPEEVGLSSRESYCLGVSRLRWYHFAMMEWSSCSAVERDPDRVSGAWLFRGTRVPVAALFENLEDGALVSQFVEWFPGVTLEQVRSVLEHAARSALAPA